MSPRLNRRQFIALSSTAGLGLLTGCATTGPRRISPNGKLQHACIGVGGMGGVDFPNIQSHPRVDIVALCDVDRERLEAAGKKAPGARLYTDWRELLATEGDRIDSVNVATPDHMHAPIELTAIRAGKHVYGQKPLAHDVAECRALAVAARKAGVMTQLGTQHAAGAGDRMGVQFLRQRIVGDVHRVILCSNRSGADRYRLPGPRPAQAEKPPEKLNWDLWLGTAPERPYAEKIYHPAMWRSWQDFGTGWSGDIGCHIFDAVWKGLELTAPTSVIATVQESWKNAPERRADVWPQTDHIVWTFPGTAISGGREITVEWFDGSDFPPEDVQKIARDGGVEKYPEEAAMVIGSEGAMLIPHQSGPQLFPKEKFRGIERPTLKGPTHYHRFVDACLGGEPAASRFEISGPMAETIILGTVALRVPGEKLEWDAKHLKIPNRPDAEKFLRRTYRSGWNVDLKV